jgi:hypothetical protein
MPQDLKKFEALFSERAQAELRVVTIRFQIEDEKDALEVAQDIALLEGSELKYLQSVSCETFVFTTHSYLRSGRRNVGTYCTFSIACRRTLTRKATGRKPYNHHCATQP